MAKILVVDDVAHNRELLSAMLRVAGYDVVTAANGQEALDKVSTELPDLIILDDRMTWLTGCEVCAQLKNQEATRLIPVIILVSSDGMKDKVRALEAGCDDVLTKPVHQGELLARVGSLVKAKRLNEELIDMERLLVVLANAIEAKDLYTKGHVERVVLYATSFAQKLGLSPYQEKCLRRAAVLHDVGKIGIEESILLKKGPLTSTEWEKMKRHPLLGERIVQPLGRDGQVLDMIRHHHERYDGTGYPDGLVGAAISLGARILAVADSFDAITSDRPYRSRLTLAQALQELERVKGKQLDPVLVLAFVALAEDGGWGLP
ncbi:MAG: response regulator [Chloroflexi bacterium]|nr:response regulator [Chloroflexota bacterium]